MAEEFLGQQCATCNDLVEVGRLRIQGEAPFEKYYLADGTFLGHGFDPEPAPHVGKSGRLAPERVCDPPGVYRMRA